MHPIATCCRLTTGRLNAVVQCTLQLCGMRCSFCSAHVRACGDHAGSRGGRQWGLLQAVQHLVDLQHGSVRDGCIRRRRRHVYWKRQTDNNCRAQVQQYGLQARQVPYPVYGHWLEGMLGIASPEGANEAPHSAALGLPELEAFQAYATGHRTARDSLLSLLSQPSALSDEWDQRAIRSDQCQGSASISDTVDVVSITLECRPVMSLRGLARNRPPRLLVPSEAVGPSSTGPASRGQRASQVSSGWPAAATLSVQALFGGCGECSATTRTERTLAIGTSVSPHPLSSSTFSPRLLEERALLVTHRAAPAAADLCA